MTITIDELRCPSEQFVADELHYFEGPEDLPVFLRHLADETGAVLAMVSIKIDPAHARTLLIWQEGSFVANKVYELAGSVCAKVLTSGQWMIQDDLDVVMPESQLVRRLGVTTFIGIPIVPLGEGPAGALCLFGRGRAAPSWDTASSLHLLTVKLGAVLGESLKPVLMFESAIARFAREALEG